MFNDTLFLINTFTINLWISLIIPLIVGLGYLSFKLSRRFVMNYLKADLSAALMTLVIVFHFLGSFIMGLVLPNNVLVDIGFFQRLYDYNELWIPVSMLALIFLFIATIGSGLSIICRAFPQRDTEV